jgi:hypothetical protein
VWIREHQVILGKGKADSLAKDVAKEGAIEVLPNQFTAIYPFV